jgi:hypothetical protein
VNEMLKKVKVYSKGDNSDEKKDKRVKKENISYPYNEPVQDENSDLYLFGYTAPNKVKSGHFTLRQFDTAIDEFKNSNRSVDKLKELSEQFQIDSNSLLNLFTLHSKFKIIKVGASQKKIESPKSQESIVEMLFTNIKTPENKPKIDQIEDKKK